MFPVLFVMPFKVVLTFESVDDIQSLIFQKKAIEQYFPLVLFIMQYKVVSAFVPAHEILRF